MAKPIFLQVSTSQQVPYASVIPGQYIFSKEKNMDIPADPLIPVTLRGSYEYMESGVIMATSGLNYRSERNIYVANAQMWQVTDEIGVILAEAHNKEHEEILDAYREFKRGGSTQLDGMLPEVEKPAITLLAKMHNDKKLGVPTIEDDGWYVDREIWYYLHRQRIRGKNTLMVGKSGTGKTELVELLGKKSKKHVEVFDMAVSNPINVFCGNLRATDGTTYFQLARFAKAIQTNSLILQDELSRAAPAANNIFLPLLDKRRILYIEEAIREEDQMIKAHERAVFWATANIGSEFIGTNMLDHALMNRYQQVGIEYPPKDKEAKVLQARCKINRSDADTLVSMAEGVRKHPALSKDVSTRQLIEIAELIHDGYSKLQAVELSILQQFESNEIDGGERAQVRSIITSM